MGATQGGTAGAGGEAAEAHALHGVGLPDVPQLDDVVVRRAHQHRVALGLERDGRDRLGVASQRRARAERVAPGGRAVATAAAVQQGSATVVLEVPEEHRLVFAAAGNGGRYGAGGEREGRGLGVAGQADVRRVPHHTFLLLQHRSRVRSVGQACHCRETHNARFLS